MKYLRKIGKISAFPTATGIPDRNLAQIPDQIPDRRSLFRSEGGNSMLGICSVLRIFNIFDRIFMSYF